MAETAAVQSHASHGDFRLLISRAWLSPVIINTAWIRRPMRSLDTAGDLRLSREFLRQYDQSALAWPMNFVRSRRFFPPPSFFDVVVSVSGFSPDCVCQLH